MCVCAQSNIKLEVKDTERQAVLLPLTHTNLHNLLVRHAGYKQVLLVFIRVELHAVGHFPVREP